MPHYHVFVRSILYLATRVQTQMRQPHTSNGDSPIGSLLSTIVQSVSVVDRRQCLEDGPDEAAKFSCGGGDGHVTVFALIKPPELFVEPVLRLEGDRNDLRRLALTVGSG